VAYRPELTRSARPATYTVDARDENGTIVPTPIAGEHPLTLYVDKREIVTLMTLGAAPEALVIGFLRNQRLVESIEEIASVQVDWEVNAAVVTTHTGLVGLDKKIEKRTATTGCGQGTVFGDLMEDIDNIRLDDDMRFDEETLFGLMNAVRVHESIYKQAGAVHGCALAKGAEILTFVEDVGRHNAVDAIAGWMWLEDIDGRDKIFYTTGRLTSEMVIKAAQMQIPVLVSRSGLTKMGHEVATTVGITMIGRAVGKHYLLFTGAQRLQKSRAAQTTGTT
jgi:FdhD protein